jgi:protein phosphatase
MTTAYKTDCGKVRTHNEDSVNITKNKSGEILAVVADGMGGHKNGEIASKIACDNVINGFSKLDTIGTKEEAITWITKIVSEANNKIYEYTKSNPDSKGMGTTIVMSIKTEKFLLIGNIGDSSGYVIKKGNLHKITTDHTLVNLLVRSGELTLEEAKNHPRKNVLMRALGANTNVDMDIFDIEDEIELVFLCSDGLTNMLDDKLINKTLNENLTLNKRLEKLIFKSNNRGGIDNITAAAIEMRNE